MVNFEQRYTMNDEGMYGIEQFHIKKHIWPAGLGVVFGALVHDSETGRQYFVTADDLAKYGSPPAPDFDENAASGHEPRS